MGLDQQTDGWIACHACDRMHDVSTLKNGDKACCRGCGEHLTTYREDLYSRVLAFAFASLVFLLIGFLYPFLSFKSSGLECVMSLPQGVMRLYEEGMPGLAAVVALVIGVIPSGLLIMAIGLAVALQFGWRASWVPLVAKLLFKLRVWSMAEVFMLGVIVSLIKIAHMATVVIGVAFWAYAAFAILFSMVLGSLDAYQVWKRIEEVGLCKN